MLTSINPKLPMRDKAATSAYYLNGIGFEEFGAADYDHYLMVQRENVQIHFFKFAKLDPNENYGQVYIRTDDLYQSFLDRNLDIQSAGHLELKPWGQKKIAMLDPDNNLLTFGQSV